MKKLAAIIIEDRPVDDLGKICYNHLKYLPKDTDLFIYTSEEAKKVFKEQLIKFNINYKFKYYNQNTEIPTTIKYIPGLEQLLQDARMKPLFNMCMAMTQPEFWRLSFAIEFL